MKRTVCGVHVQRTQLVNSSARVAHLALFRTAADFRRFCDEDELRFSYPLTYLQIKREIDALLQLDA
ncbi:MAG: hypothetical protein M3Y55_15725 [Pseudomonadota bacterium]|nr:hypothetical protein [Pseudomonadota bacterium]